MILFRHLNLEKNRLFVMLARPECGSGSRWQRRRRQRQRYMENLYDGRQRTYIITWIVIKITIEMTSITNREPKDVVHGTERYGIILFADEWVEAFEMALVHTHTKCISVSQCWALY